MREPHLSLECEAPKKTYALLSVKAEWGYFNFREGSDKNFAKKVPEL